LKPNESHIVEKFRKKRRHCLNKKNNFFLIPFLKITLPLHSCPIDTFVLCDMSRYKENRRKHVAIFTHSWEDTIEFATITGHTKTITYSENRKKCIINRVSDLSQRN